MRRRSVSVVTSLFIVFSAVNFTFSQQKAPVYSPVIKNIDSLKHSVLPLMEMSIDEVIAMVPTKSGFFFIGCPNCNGGAEEAGVLNWKPGMGDKVRCNFCSMVFPNDKFPNNREKVILTPGGTKQIYRYYENPEGRQYFYEAHAWYDRWLWINKMAGQLAQLWYTTKDNAYGDRAAAITGRFAQVFPDYAVRYDYPNQPKKFFPADQKWPYEGLSDYRGSKWSWWAYMDIPSYPITVYDILSAGYDWKRMDRTIGPDTEERIEHDLLRLGYSFAMAHPEDYSNMAPTKYRDMIRLGRVLRDPAVVHEAVNRFTELLSRGFFADGWWKEGSPSYHNQTVDGLQAVNEVLKGYTDPVSWTGERFQSLDLTVGLPLFKRALDVCREAVMPNGHVIPLNDTWASDEGWDTESKNPVVSRLWPSLGNAALLNGEGRDQVMLNLNWSGNYGHSHADNGSIILYAAGKELLSDIGYTHTKYKSWALTTASHNTVVIDQKEQDRGSSSRPATGNLNFYDDKDPHVKAIDLDASPAYKAAKTYRRRLIMVHAAPGYDYVVDRFDVEGGEEHDWFLHGMCEEEGILETSIGLDCPLEGTLVPDWGGKQLPKTQYETDPTRFHPYLFLRDVKTGTKPENLWTATWRYKGGQGLRIHNISPPGTQVFRFRSPSIRPANEDDNKLDNFMRAGIMQRHSDRSSIFLSVHEPFRSDPWIESVHTGGSEIIVRYKINGTSVEDRLRFENGVTVRSSAGWEYSSGKAISGVVEELERGAEKWSLRLDREVPVVNYVRLDLADGGTRYYPVAAVRGNRLELKNDPGFTMDIAGGGVTFHTFPKDKHPGPLKYTLFVP